MTRDDSVQVIPARTVRFRPRGSSDWEERYFKIFTRQEMLTEERSCQPLWVRLETNIDGYRFVEFPGLDIAYALSMALFSVEGLLLLLTRLGDVEVRPDTKFDLESDSVYFSNRFDQLRMTFRKHLE